MKQRLQTLLATEKLASSKFADILGVNRSSISHLLSGRNNPSLDFLQKVLVKFPHINPDWLLMGQGAMYRNKEEGKPLNYPNQLAFNETQSNTKSIFSSEETNAEKPSTPKRDSNSIKEEKTKGLHSSKDSLETKDIDPITIPPNNSSKDIEKIVFFYKDNTFDSYYPNKG